MPEKLNLFKKENISVQQKCYCGRCGSLCKVDPLTGSKARMLKRGSKVKGLCINCAVHDQLRHMYPANLLLANSGPMCLALPQIQEQFADILKAAGTDAEPNEIDWSAVIENWELPFPTKLKRTATNPVSQTDLDREPEEERERRRRLDERLKDPRSDEEIAEAKYNEAAELLLNAMRKRNENI